MINIVVVGWIFVALAVVCWISAIVSRAYDNPRRWKVLFTLFIVCLVILFGIALMKNYVNDSGQVVTTTQSESRMIADAENITIDSENGLTSVMDDHGKTVVYPSKLVEMYADPSDEKVKTVNVTTRTEKVTKGIKVLGIWLISPNAESIVTLVTFD